MFDQQEHIAVTSFESEGQWHSVTELKLEGLLPAELAMAEHGVKTTDAYLQDVWQRQTLMLNMLASAGYFLSGGDVADRQIELRFISVPNTNLSAEVVITILFKMSHTSVMVSQSAALQQAREFSESLRVLQPESSWSFVSREQALEELLLPFDVIEGAEICRRTGDLDVSGNIGSVIRSQSMGFFNAIEPQDVDSARGTSRRDKVSTVFPYNPKVQGWALLCRRLLQHTSAIMVRMVLRPSLLEEEDRRLLEQQVAWLHSVVNGIDEEAAERNIFHHQLEMLIKNGTDRLLAFQDKAIEVYSEIYSNAPLSQGIIDYLGATITRQPSDNNYSQGGYDWVFIRNEHCLSETLRFMGVSRSRASEDSEGYPRGRYLMDVREALAVFHLPFVSHESFPGVKTLLLRNVPSQIPVFMNGRVIGENEGVSGHRHEVMLSRDDRRRHLYVTGQTGSGKSTLLEKMVLDDILHGEGVCLIDPHGDFAESVLCKIPAERVDDVVYLNPAMDEHPLGINMLEFSNEREKLFVVQEMISMIERLFDDKYTGSAAVTGPMFYHNLRMGLLYIMSDEDPVTLLDLYRFFTVPDYYHAFDISLQKNDPLLQAFHRSDTFNYFRKGTEAPFAWYIVSKFDNFLGDPMIRNIICQPSTTVDFDAIINQGKILIVNLAKGLVGEVNSRFLGMLVISKLQLAAMRRVRIPQHQRRDFYLYVDEFQNLATKNFSTLLSESRKFRLNLVLANQFVNQLMPEIVAALQGNVGSTIIFRTGVEDAAMFERLTEPVFLKNDLLRLPNWHAVALLQHHGQVTRPFTLRTVLHPQKQNHEISEYIQARTVEKHGMERKKVEMGIRLQEELRMEQVERKLAEIQNEKRAFKKEAMG